MLKESGEVNTASLVESGEVGAAVKYLFKESGTVDAAHESSLSEIGVMDNNASNNVCETVIQLLDQNSRITEEAAAAIIETITKNRD